MKSHKSQKPLLFSISRTAGLLLLLALISAITLRSVKAAIELVSFEATLENGEVYLEWETASEIDLKGFYIVRSFSPDGSYTRISNLIYGEGDIIGATYSFTDTDITPNINYYYKLEDVDTSNISSFHGPVVVGPATPTPSLTPSSTPETPTITNTPANTTQPSNTPTFDPSASPTFSPTPTLSLTPSITPTASETPTAAPPTSEISQPKEFTFPTTTPSPTPAATPMPLPSETNSPFSELLPTFSIIGGIIVFWVLLGIAYFKFIRPNNEHID